MTKQSISRVLKDLLEQEYVEQKSGPRDRRERRLWLTEKGVKLERELTDRQSQRFARAYRETGADAVEGFRKVLLGLLDPVERARGRQADSRERPLSIADSTADKPHVLVVDDDTRLRELLKSFLTRNGFRVSTAGNAAAARQQLEALDFDLIVLDVMMPGQTGLEFAGELRKTNAVPILMLTAMGDAKDRIAGLEKGVDDYLGKPFEPRELLLRIQSVLRRGRPVDDQRSAASA